MPRSFGDVLPRAELVATGPLDKGDWMYVWPLHLAIARRLDLLRALLRGQTWEHCLEVGYGSGIFMPLLARHARRLSGIDVHTRPDAVREVLSRRGIDADLRTASVTDLPQDDESVDVVVAVSSLEFVDDLEGACREIDRVLRPGGDVIVITPGQGKLQDFALRVLSGSRAEDTFQGRRRSLVSTLTSHFDVVDEVVFPPVRRLPRLYTGLRLRSRGS